MRRILITYCLIVVFFFASGQNLVPNYSFEEYYNCPDSVTLRKQHFFKYWTQPTRGSVDYFNTCSEECGVPENLFGNQHARTGNAYAGIHVLYYNDYREYLQVELKSPLEENCKYRIQFYVSLSEHSLYAISEMGVLFTKNPVYSISKRSLWVDTFMRAGDTTVYYIERQYRPQFQNSYKFMLKSNTDWMIVSGSFWAKGGEKFMTIGNFLSDFSSHKEKVRKGHDGVSYYYIDDVTVFRGECITNKERAYKTFDEVEELKIGQSIILKNVLFEFDKTDMLPGSYKELDRLVKILQENPQMEIEIRGHTDEKGSVAYNLALSRNRAKAVTLYITSKGISLTRIRYKGYGKSVPIATNTTEEGRQLNRRVEFKVLKN